MLSNNNLTASVIKFKEVLKRPFEQYNLFSFSNYIIRRAFVLGSCVNDRNLLNFGTAEGTPGTQINYLSTTLLALICQALARQNDFEILAGQKEAG